MNIDEKNQYQESKCLPGLRIKRFLGVGKGISILLFILFVLIVPVHAESNDCEKLAKDYQRAYGGDLILVQPLINNSGGAYDLGEYKGHWMNRAWNKQVGNYYYDPQENAYYSSIRGIELFYRDLWSQDVVVLNYNRGEISFGIIWHY